MHTCRFITANIIIIGSISILLSIGLCVIIISVETEDSITQEIHLGENSDVLLELDGEDCPIYSGSSSPLLLTLENPRMSPFGAYLHIRSNQSEFNETCYSAPGSSCTLEVPKFDTILIQIHSLRAESKITESKDLSLTCANSLNTALIAGAVILSIGLVTGCVFMSVLVCVFVLNWTCKRDSSNAVYG